MDKPMLEPAANLGLINLILAAEQSYQSALLWPDLEAIHIQDKPQHPKQCKEGGQVACPGQQHQGKADVHRVA